MTCWIYKQIIIPRITYGCISWWHKAKQQTFKRKLDRLQRIAELAITGALRSTPTAALNVALGLVPLEFVIEAKARSTAIRLAANNIWFSFNQNYGHCLLNLFLNQKKSYWLESDKIPDNFDFSKPFEILIDSDKLDKIDNPGPDSIVCYTDGSKGAR